MSSSTIREIFRYNRWANDKLVAAVRGFEGAELDRAFEMGCGTLRGTLAHVYGAERAWYECIDGPGHAELPHSGSLTQVDEISGATSRLADAREAWLQGLDATALDRRSSYTDRNGRQQAHDIGGILLHVCNHGMHHRAQALNMIRHLEGEPPRLDYLIMRCELPTVEYSGADRESLRDFGMEIGVAVSAPAALDVDCIRRYYRYTDWANEAMFAAAGSLDDAALDRTFDIGVGTIRKTLIHTHEADSWWYRNWQGASAAEYEELPVSMSLEELRDACGQVSHLRGTYLETIADDDLTKVVEACVRPDVVLKFRLGESMLQVCQHSTHHRAQAMNMLRSLGGEVPVLDLAEWLRGGSA